MSRLLVVLLLATVIAVASAQYLGYGGIGGYQYGYTNLGYPRGIYPAYPGLGYGAYPGYGGGLGLAYYKK